MTEQIVTITLPKRGATLAVLQKYGVYLAIVVLLIRVIQGRRVI